MGRCGKTIAVITARSASQRLPDKYNADICGKPMLLRVVEQAHYVATLDDVVVATVKGDEKIAGFCRAHGIPFFAGSENDILDRLYHTGTAFKAHYIVRIWGDSPIVGPRLIYSVIDLLNNSEEDYAYAGNDTGVVAAVSMKVLARAHDEVSDPKEREWIHTHFTRKARYSVDTAEDLERVREWVKSRELVMQAFGTSL